MLIKYTQLNGTDSGYFNARNVCGIEPKLNAETSRSIVTLTNGERHDVPQKPSTLAATIETAAAATSLTTIS